MLVEHSLFPHTTHFYFDYTLGHINRHYSTTHWPVESYQCQVSLRFYAFSLRGDPSIVSKNID